jgi:hypothetical protein
MSAIDKALATCAERALWAIKRASKRICFAIFILFICLRRIYGNSYLGKILVESKEQTSSARLLSSRHTGSVRRQCEKAQISPDEPLFPKFTRAAINRSSSSRKLVDMLS